MWDQKSIIVTATLESFDEVREGFWRVFGMERGTDGTSKPLEEPMRLLFLCFVYVP